MLANRGRRYDYAAFESSEMLEGMGNNRPTRHNPGVGIIWSKELVSSARDKLYLVIESIKPDTKHSRYSAVPAPNDGAGGPDMA